MIGYWAFSVAYSSAKTMSGNRFRMFTDKAVLVDQNRPGRLVTRHSHALDIVSSYVLHEIGGIPALSILWRPPATFARCLYGWAMQASRVPRYTSAQIL